MKTVDVTTEILINCPLSKVAGFVSDPDNATKWYVNIKSVERLPAGGTGKTAQPLEIGSLIAFKAQFLGKQISYVYEVVENIPERKFVMRTADGPFPMETTYTWEAMTDQSTRMTLRNRGIPSGFSRLFAPFMSRMMKRANRKDLMLLKQILEK